MNEEEFSVYQFFPGGSYERLCHFVGAEEAMKVALAYTTNVASKVGITQRVIITDGGDSTVFEWKFKEGIVWPKQEKSNGVETNGNDG